MNPFDQYAYGGIGQWLHERIAGLARDPAPPVFQRNRDPFVRTEHMSGVAPGPI